MSRKYPHTSAEATARTQGRPFHSPERANRIGVAYSHYHTRASRRSTSAGLSRGNTINYYSDGTARRGTEALLLAQLWAGVW